MINHISSIASLWALLIHSGAALFAALASAIPIFGNTNQSKEGLPQNNRFFACPSAVTSGMPVLIGTIAAVAMDAYDSTLGGTVFKTDGSFFLTVAANSQLSPNAGVQVNPGDELHASGTYDSTTNVTYSLTIDKTIGNTPFGNMDGTGVILSGGSAVVSVRLKTGGSPGPYTP